MARNDRGFIHDATHTALEPPEANSLIAILDDVGDAILRAESSECCPVFFFNHEFTCTVNNLFLLSMIPGFTFDFLLVIF